METFRVFFLMTNSIMTNAKIQAGFPFFGRNRRAFPEAVSEKSRHPKLFRRQSGHCPNPLLTAIVKITTDYSVSDDDHTILADATTGNL